MGIRCFLNDAADAGTSWARLIQLRHRSLNLVFHIIRQLLAAGGEELDAVVRHRVVGRRDHHADVRTVVVRKKRQTRSGDNANAQHIHTLRGHASRHRRSQHLTGYARVAANQRSRPTALGATVLGQYGCGRCPQFQCHRGRQRFISQAADTISSKESSHAFHYARPLLPQPHHSNVSLHSSRHPRCFFSVAWRIKVTTHTQRRRDP